MLIHLIEDLSNLREEITGPQSAVLKAPLITTYFCNCDIVRLQRLPYLRRQPMNKFCAQGNRSSAGGIVESEHAAADPIARLKDSHGETVAR